jgi:hypothetical protein
MSILSALPVAAGCVGRQALAQAMGLGTDQQLLLSQTVGGRERGA